VMRIRPNSRVLETVSECAVRSVASEFGASWDRALKVQLRERRVHPKAMSAFACGRGIWGMACKMREDPGEVRRIGFLLNAGGSLVASITATTKRGRGLGATTTTANKSETPSACTSRSSANV